MTEFAAETVGLSLDDGKRLLQNGHRHEHAHLFDADFLQRRQRLKMLELERDTLNWSAGS
jgi:hypothetical protein